MYKRFIGIVLSLFFFIGASAQIRGVVVDADDGYGVPYASIFLPNLKHSITTDGEGKFELPRHGQCHRCELRDMSSSMSRSAVPPTVSQ